VGKIELDSTEGREILEENRSLVETWVLADKYGLPALQNLASSAISQICDYQRELPSRTYHLVYNKTSKGSPLRRLCIITLAQYGHPELVIKTPKYLPVPMVYDALAFLLERSGFEDQEELEEAYKSCLVLEP
jgi:hypothetical protein